MSGQEAWEQPAAGRRWGVVLAVLALAAGAALWAGAAQGDRAPLLDVSEADEPLPAPSPAPEPTPAQTPTEAPDGVGRWQPVTHAPIVRRTGHSAVWTGDEVIVWGGVRTDPRPHVAEARFLADGAAYATRRGTWRRLQAAPIPGRHGHSAVWTGREMLVWGGSADGPGAAYDPRANRWRTVPVADLPTAPPQPSVVEAGRRLVLWDGSGGMVLRAGGRTWEPLSTPPLEPREGAAVVWAADRLFVWGGAAAARHFADGAVLHLPPYGHGSRVSVGR